MLMSTKQNDNDVQKLIEEVKKVINVEKEFEQNIATFPIVIGNVLQDVNEYKKECEENLKGVIELCNKVKGEIENNKESGNGNEDGFKSKIDVLINEINTLNNNVINNANKELQVYKSMMDYFVLSEKEHEAQHNIKYLLFMFKQSNEMLCDFLRKYNVVSSSSSLQHNSSINNNSLSEIKRLNMQVEQLAQIIQVQETVINDKNNQNVQTNNTSKANNENENQLKIKELQKTNEDLLKQIKSLKEENKQLKLKYNSNTSNNSNSHNNNSSSNNNNSNTNFPKRNSNTQTQKNNPSLCRSLLSNVAKSNNSREQKDNETT